MDVRKTESSKKGIIGLVDTKGFCDKEIAKLIEEKSNKIAKNKGWKIKKINLPLDIALETYYIIVYTEYQSEPNPSPSPNFKLSNIFDKFSKTK